MRIRIWNAYASNNSGSYTIVGSLPSEQVATEVATALAAMIEDHTRWIDSRGAGVDDSESPLAAFCKAHDLSWSSGVGCSDDWPAEYVQDRGPQVLTVAKQVVVHAPYTVTLPRTFGEFIYKKGGRVQVEENHAHHPIAVVAQFWWRRPAKDDERLERARATLIADLIAAITGPNGVLSTPMLGAFPPAWRTADGFGDPQLTVGVVFEDLIHGVAALRDAGERHGATLHVRLYELRDEATDPFLDLRSGSP